MAKIKLETVEELRYALRKERALVVKLEEQNKKLRSKLNNIATKKNHKVISDFFTKCKTDKVNTEFSTVLDELLAETFCIPVAALRMKSRKKDIVFARQAGCYILHVYYPRRYKTISLGDIGWHYGYVNHTTVLNSIEAITDRLAAVKSSDARLLRELFAKIEKILEQTPVVA
jgi:chromosomal replication initiation ATPase DnaA